MKKVLKERMLYVYNRPTKDSMIYTYNGKYWSSHEENLPYLAYNVFSNEIDPDDPAWMTDSRINFMAKRFKPINIKAIRYNKRGGEKYASRKSIGAIYDLIRYENITDIDRLSCLCNVSKEWIKENEEDICKCFKSNGFDYAAIIEDRFKIVYEMPKLFVFTHCPSQSICVVMEYDEERAKAEAGEYTYMEVIEENVYDNSF